MFSKFDWTKQLLRSSVLLSTAALTVGVFTSPAQAILVFLSAAGSETPDPPAVFDNLEGFGEDIGQATEDNTTAPTNNIYTYQPYLAPGGGILSPLIATVQNYAFFTPAVVAPPQPASTVPVGLEAVRLQGGLVSVAASGIPLASLINSGAGNDFGNQFTITFNQAVIINSFFIGQVTDLTNPFTLTIADGTSTSANIAFFTEVSPFKEAENAVL